MNKMSYVPTSLDNAKQTVSVVKYLQNKTSLFSYS
jgi:hypothetical protein